MMKITINQKSEEESKMNLIFTAINMEFLLKIGDYNNKI